MSRCFYSPVPTPSPAGHRQEEVAQYPVPSLRRGRSGAGAEQNLFARFWPVCGLLEGLVFVLSDSELKQRKAHGLALGLAEAMEGSVCETEL